MKFMSCKLFTNEKNIYHAVACYQFDKDIRGLHILKFLQMQFIYS